MAETEHITVAETSEGPGGNGDPGREVSLPVVELLTGRGFVTGKSGAGKSILEGTPVYTDEGRKPIEDVSEGEKVLSLNKQTYEQEFREVEATIEHTDDRLLRVTLEDGTELVGTEDHSFLTADDLEISPVRGDELEEGMWMPLSRELPSPNTVQEIDLGEYVGDANNIVLDGGTITSGPRTEDRTLTLDFGTGKEVGLYLAEGSFDGGQTLQISNVDDGVHDFLDDRGYNVYERTCNKGFQPYAEFLESEFGTGSGDKRIPDWVFETPAEFRAGLLSGYVDGDGTIGEKALTTMSKSEALVDGIRELLRQFGISTTVREKFTLYQGEERRFLRLTVDAFCTERFAEVVDLSVESKAADLAALCEELDTGQRYNSKDMIPNFGSVLNTAARESGWTERDSDNRVDGASVHHLTRQQKAGRKTYNRLVDELDVGGRAQAFGESDIQWKRITSIEPLDEERKVYDLDVRLNDNFIANGVFVHNSNTASVFVEKLLDNGFGLLIVDIDGEYYGLKEEYEILHAGADEECDIQITAEHAEKMASLALEQNVPIILDMSSFLDESEAEEVLTAVSRHLFAKAKKQKQPFLMLVEEVHEYIPEGGSVGECGKMLIKIGKRGRKHGLGIVGISQRPADVKKDFITQCDWLVWHRLTWNNDTKVVKRILDSEYSEAVENLGDGEGFLVTDWAEQVRRVQFQRKQTFDAGATPGLDDFERPDLKSVSDDLVSELAEISEEQQARDDRIAELREQLDAKNSRIAELEAELQDARDMSRMADQFVDALVRHVDGPNPGKTEQERMREDRAGAHGASPHDVEAAVATAAAAENGSEPDGSDSSESGSTDESGAADAGSAFGEGGMFDDAAFAAAMDAVEESSEDAPGEEPGDTDASDDAGEISSGEQGSDGDADEEESTATDSGFSAEEVLSRLNAVSETPTDAATDGGATVDEPQAEADIVDGETNLPIDDPLDQDIIDGDESAPPEFREGITSRGASEFDIVDGEDGPDDPIEVEEPIVVRELKADVAGMETKARKMLNFYREFGPGTPLNAHFAAGGDGDRTSAYAHNRTLRTAGLVEHVGRGRYEYCLRDHLEEELDGHVDPETIEELARNVEEATLGATSEDDE